MTVTELITELRALGVDLWADSGQLRFRAPQGILTPERKAALREHKAALLELLDEERTRETVTADPASRHEPFPLTDVQAAYLLGRHDPFGYGGVACHGYLEVTYPRLDPTELVDAWNRLVARHDMLRAVVEPDGWQRVLPEVPRLTVRTTDLRGTGPDAREEHFASVRAELGHQMYDTTVWPLFEVRLTRTDDGDVLHISLDALIADWASAGILLDELDVLLAGGELPPLQVQFRDYLLAERGLRDSTRHRLDRDYWLARVDELPPAPALPLLTGRPESPGTPERFERHHFRLPADRWRKLCDRARDYGLTPSTAVLAAYACVLERWSGQLRFTLNLTLLNRLPLHPDVDRLIGDFTSVNLLAVDGGRGVPFHERAAAIGTRMFADLDHRLYSGVEVLREIARRRGREAALMPVVFTGAIGLGPSHRDRTERRAGHGITQTPQVVVDCQVTDDADGLEVNWDVRHGMFPEGLVEDMFAAIGALLGRLADTDEAWEDREPVGLPAWQGEERRKVNDTARPLPTGLLHEPVLRQAARTPHAPAVISSAGTVTYEVLLARANGVAATLLPATDAVAPGDRVAVVMDRGVEQVVGVLGALLAGAAYLPVDTTQPALRRNKLLGDAGVRCVLTQSWLADTQEWPDGVRVIAVDRVKSAAPCPPVPVPPGSLAYVIYTSGSTGDPKGVMISHRAALNTVVDICERFGVTGDDRVLGVAQLGFDLSVYDIFGPLSVGGALVMPEASRRSDPSHWAELINEHAVTVWNTVPAQLQMLTDYLASERDTADSLRLSLLSGDWIPVTLPDRVRALVPGLRVISLGGATEASIWSIHHPVGRVDPQAPSIPYGTPLTNQGFRVLDHALRDAPVWVPGELYITGAGLAEGYWGDEELTAARFFHHPLDGQRLYRTGDLGRYLPGGTIEFLGREDNQVKIRGHRIELGEIEAALLAHPEVTAAAAVTAGDGRDDRVLLGFAVPAAHTTEAPDTARTIAAVRAAADRETGGLDVSAVADHVRRLHDASLAAMLNVLRERGLFGTPDQEHTAEEILSAAQVAERHHWLVRRWLASLTEHGWLRHTSAPDRYARLRTTDASQVAAAWREVAARGMELGLCTPEFVRYHERHVELLHALLEGEQDPFELLFPEGSTDTALALYADDSIARYLNQGAAALVNRIATTLDDGTRLRVLEAGAGTGATTSRIVPLLEGYDVDYHFTDVSAFFLAAARERFAELPWMRFGRFDLDGDHREQGLAPNSYDVVVCAGMLNSVRDPRAALATVGALLDGDGWLVFTEPTGELPHLLLTQGFMMEPAGDDRAYGQSKLMSRQEWAALVEAAGGEQVLCLPDDEHSMAAQGMHLFAARFKSGRARVSGDDLGAFLAERLPAHMVPAQLQVVDALPVTANGKIDRRTLGGLRLGVPDMYGTRTDTSDAGGLEGRLGSLWASALGLPQPVGPWDNVFDLGADSLVLARVAGRLREEIPEAADVPFDTLLRQMLNDPHIAPLAAALRSTRPKPPVAPAPGGPGGSTGVGGLLGRRAAHSNALLVPFGGATPSVGESGADRPARVLFHSALGTMDHFRSLAKELVAQEIGPVLGLAVADPDEYCAAAPKELIARIADDYTDRLLAEGHTRFQLIGYCLGGLTAAEVARRMLERGVEEVDLRLVDSIPMLVDTDEELAIEAIFATNLNLDPAETVFGEDVDRTDVYRAFDLLMRHNGGRVPAGAMAELSGDPGLDAVAAAVRERSSVPQEERLARYARHAAERAGVPVGPELIPALYRVFRHSVLAAHIEPEPYLGDMTFLRAMEEQSFGITGGVAHLTQRYWEKTCVGGFEVIDVPGNHFSVIEPPHTTEVARHLGAGLDRGEQTT